MEWVSERANELGRSKHARFCATSLCGVAMTQVLLLLFVHGLGAAEVAANVIAVSVSCVPTFLLNRYWVWGISSRGNLGAQIAAFWGMAVAGLTLSTVIVSQLARTWDSPLVANVGNIAGFGLLWVAKFLLLDRVLFRPIAVAAPVAVTAP